MGFFAPYDLQNKLIKTDQLLIEHYVEHSARISRPYKTCKEGEDYMKHVIIIIIIIIIISFMQGI